MHMTAGSLHSFKNDTDKTAKLLISLDPAGLEQMSFEVGETLAEDAEIVRCRDCTTAEIVLPPSQADLEKLLEAAPRYGVEIKVPQH